MTDDQIIIEVAKLDGWLDVKEYTYKYDYMGETGELKQLQGRSEANLGHLVGLPKYLESRDAIVPVIEKQSKKVRVLIARALSEIVLGRSRTWVTWLEDDIADLFLATPRQLCIALLKACGKWRGDFMKRAYCYIFHKKFHVKWHIWYWRCTKCGEKFSHH
jgi:hypothetical protein